MRKTKRRTPTRPAVLPPIPTDTPAGIRARAIADTLNAVDRVRNLELQPEDFEQIAEPLKVPALYIASVYLANSDGAQRPQDIEAYVAWRRGLAVGEAVA